MQKLRLIINNLLTKNVECEDKDKGKHTTKNVSRMCTQIRFQCFNRVSKFEIRDALFQFCFNVSNFGDQQS